MNIFVQYGEPYCCLSLSKCVNDKVENNHRRLRRKSKMRVALAQWLANWPPVLLQVPGSIPAAGEENLA